MSFGVLNFMPSNFSARTVILPSFSVRVTLLDFGSQASRRPCASQSRPLVPAPSRKILALPVGSNWQIDPLPDMRTPNSGCHAGPSPPNSPSTSTLSLAPFSKMSAPIREEAERRTIPMPR
jgi:hypothetical protein